MKDPAILLYKDKWLIATKGMRADAKGWYLNLIIYQHEMGSLPNDIEELANLCDVRFSEFDQFKQVFEQVLKQKFKQNENNRLENDFSREIIKNRETFKEKRSESGKLSYVLKYFRKNFKYNQGFEEWFKSNVIIDFDIKNEQVLKQVFKQNIELYINVNVNINESIDINKEEINETCFSFDEFWDLYAKSVDKAKCLKVYSKIKEVERLDIKNKLPIYLKTITDKKYQKNPLTYLNGKCWNDIDEKSQNLIAYGTNKKPIGATKECFANKPEIFCGRIKNPNNT